MRASWPAMNLTQRSEQVALVQWLLQAATYNVNGRKPPPGLDLAPWLGGAAEADIVVVGFQEIEPLNASNVMNGERLVLDRVFLMLQPAPAMPPQARKYLCQAGLKLSRRTGVDGRRGCLRATAHYLPDTSACLAQTWWAAAAMRHSPGTAWLARR